LIEKEFDLSEHIKDFKIETETDLKDCFFVKDVAIDFKAKTILVTF
jgi:hypothetical protein